MTIKAKYKIYTSILSQNNIMIMVKYEIFKTKTNIKMCLDDCIKDICREEYFKIIDNYIGEVKYWRLSMDEKLPILLKIIENFGGVKKMVKKIITDNIEEKKEEELNNKRFSEAYNQLFRSHELEFEIDEE
jgi:hypothetical protein